VQQQAIKAMSTTDHRPVLIVIAGPNGSGKTTITSKILRHEWLEDAVYINPDQVAQDKFGDLPSMQPALLSV
jgi:predicted ABC-type ATPase